MVYLGSSSGTVTIPSSEFTHCYYVWFTIIGSFPLEISKRGAADFLLLRLPIPPPEDKFLFKIHKSESNVLK
jgi:hypothetical protein